MRFTMAQKTALFIDGANVSATARTLNLDIDYRKVLQWIKKDYILVRAFYYTALFEEKTGNIPLQELVDWLAHNGFHVQSKKAKSYEDRQGNLRIKGNMDMEIAVDSMQMAKHIDHMILFSGDGDFRYLVEAIQREGVIVSIVSSVEAKVCAPELRRQADNFFELSEMREILKRER